MGCECHGVDRRSFLKFAIGGTAGMAFAPYSGLWGTEMFGGARAKACILLWMDGGPSQLDTFDPKPGMETGGPFKAIATSVRGMKISQHLPSIAKQGRHFSIIRSMTTGEPDHLRGQYLMHTGYKPIPGLPFAPIGTVVSYELQRKNFPLPTYIAIAPNNIPQSPILGEAHLPFAVVDIQNPLPNAESVVGNDREKGRADLLRSLENRFLRERRGREIAKRADANRKAHDLMTTPLKKAFNLQREPEKLRKEYGEEFGQQCLLARRLVQAGVPFVEVGLGGWDTHSNNFEDVKRLSRQLDSGMGTLLKDLVQKDMLDETLVVWAGEFGRTPKINGNNGRDHWAKSWTVVLAGGGIQGGRIIGQTDKIGREIVKRPVRYEDYFATLYRCLGIDWKKRYVLSGRKVRYAPSRAKPIRELF